MRGWLVLAIVVACGRVRFDPIGNETSGDGGNGPGDGGNGDGAVDTTTTSPAGELCTAPIDIAIGQTLSNQTIAGAADDYTTGCGSFPEVVFRFTQPAMGARQVDVLGDFNGSVFINSSLSGCPPMNGGCTSLTANQLLSQSPTLAAGTRYIYVERSSGGTTFSISLP